MQQSCLSRKGVLKYVHVKFVTFHTSLEQMKDTKVVIPGVEEQLS